MKNECGNFGPMNIFVRFKKSAPQGYFPVKRDRDLRGALGIRRRRTLHERVPDPIPIKSKAMRTPLAALVAVFITIPMAASCAFAANDSVSARPASVAGSTAALYGEWDGGGRASKAIYGTMSISKSGISWGGDSNGKPRCTVSYQRLAEESGVKFQDQVGVEYITAPGDSRYKTYLLRIKGGKCALGHTHLRLTLDGGFDVGYLAMVEYSEYRKPVGHLHFFKN